MKNHLKKAYGIFEQVLSKLCYMLMKALPLEYYQPLYGSDKTQITRACEDRWAVIGPRLSKANGSTLDIGCNIGYFTFKAAEQGKMAMGVDADPFYILACRTIRLAKGRDNTFFLKAMVDRSFLEKMPAYETIFNFSVFHHWVKAYGETEAKEMMKILAGKCSALFFETGQPDEAGTKWAEKLAFMGAQPDQWIIGFLKECGFSTVEVIGTFATGLTKTDRYLFLAQK